MFLNMLNISGSALTAEQYRLNLIAQNITNAETTRTENGGPYKRKTPVFEEVSDYSSTGSSFSDYLGYLNSRGKNAGVSSSSKNDSGTVSNVVSFSNFNNAVYVKPDLGGYELNGANYETSGNFVRNKYNLGENISDGNGGVRISKVIEDPTPGKMVYNPEHPDANEEGYVEMPNVNMTQEMVDMMGASRAYEANVQVINTIKAMASKALEIGR